MQYKTQLDAALSAPLVMPGIRSPVVNRNQIATLLINNSYLFGSPFHHVYVSENGAAAVLSSPKERSTPHFKVLAMNQFSMKDSELIQGGNISSLIKKCRYLPFDCDIIESDKVTQIEFCIDWGEYVCIDVDTLLVDVLRRTDRRVLAEGGKGYCVKVGEVEYRTYQELAKSFDLKPSKYFMDIS